MDNEGNTPTLRDTIAEQMDALEPSPTPAPGVKPEDSVSRPAEPSGAQDAGDKLGRTAGRARDEQGRLLPGKAEIPAQTPPAATPGAVPNAALTPAPEPAIECPKSWKLEMAPTWAKISPDAQKYIIQREGEFHKGVQTYRQEYENARPVMEALAPHIPLLQQHGIDPGQQVARYMHVHKTLALGSPQDKLGLFAQMAKDYQVPLEQLFVRGNDGQVYLNSQLPSYTPPAQQQDVGKLIEEKLIEKEAQQAARSFTEAKDAAGNPAHPHFDTVRETMSQLLAAGIAQDLQSAYDAALRLPQHQALFDQLQQQKTAADEAEKQKKLVEAANLARRNAVSIRSATPASKVTPPANSLRGVVEAAFDEHVPGRV